MMAVRACWGIFLICLHLFAHSAGQDTEKMEWQGEENLPEIIMEGSNIVLKCVGRGLTSIDAVSIKRYGGGSNSIIVDNQIVTPDFATLKRSNGQPRYTAHYEYDDNSRIGTLNLTISEIKGEDSGKLGCTSSASNSNTEYMMLNVEVPVSEVYITQMLSNMTIVPVQSGSTLRMKHMTAGGFACNAKVVGSTTLPIVKAYINGKEHLETFDTFKENVTEVTTVRQGMLFMLDYERIVSLSDFTMTPDYRYHGSTLRCEGYTRGYSNTKKSATANLVVEFAPIIQCEKFQYYAEVGESITFTCSVLANPEATIYVSFGYNGDENEKEVIMTEEEEDGYIYKREDSPGNSTVSLTISSVSKAHYGYKYKIKASNTYNTNNPVDSDMELFEGKDPNDPTSSGNRAVTGIIAILLQVLALHFL